MKKLFLLISLLGSPAMACDMWKLLEQGASKEVKEYGATSYYLHGAATSLDEIIWSAEFTFQSAGQVYIGTVAVDVEKCAMEYVVSFIANKKTVQ
ncbi:MAG: hypothetical protein AB7O96_07410 [Pseudobdellovibrionaceae bacterium]